MMALSKGEGGGKSDREVNLIYVSLKFRFVIGHEQQQQPQRGRRCAKYANSLFFSRATLNSPGTAGTGQHT